MLGDSSPHCDAKSKVRLHDVENRRCVDTEKRLKVMASSRGGESFSQRGTQARIKTEGGRLGLESDVVEKAVGPEAHQGLEPLPALSASASLLGSLPDRPAVLRGRPDVAIAVVHRDPHRKVLVDERIQADHEAPLRVDR